MGNRDDLQVKSEILAAIGAEQIRILHNIPIPVYIQEAETLIYGEIFYELFRT